MEILSPHLFSIFPLENTSPFQQSRLKAVTLGKKNPDVILFRVSGPHVDYITSDWKLVSVAQFTICWYTEPDFTVRAYNQVSTCN